MSVVPEHRPLSPRLARKARARYQEGRVRFLPLVVTYGVEGDTPDSLYKVDVENRDGTDHMTCDCPANGQCWHIQAVRIARREDEELVPASCPRCNGTGEVQWKAAGCDNSCPSCNGTGEAS